MLSVFLVDRTYVPAFLPDELDKSASQCGHFDESVTLLVSYYDGLVGRAADGNDQTSAIQQLVLERLRNRVASSGDNDPVIWRKLRKSQGTISNSKGDVGNACFFQGHSGLIAQGDDAFDAVNMLSESGQNGALIT